MSEAVRSFAMADKGKIVTAISDLGNRVTVADVVAKTGLPLEEVSSLMNAIAAETDANLEVSGAGAIYYCFPSHLKYLYLKHGLEKALQLSAQKLFTVVFFLFRISFGLILIFSLICFFGIALIVQTFLAGLTGTTDAVAAMWRDFFGLMGRLALSDLVFWGKGGETASIPKARGIERQGAHKAKGGGKSGKVPTIKGQARQGFLLNCFSFLFGEGDPNRGLEEERSKLVAQVIRLNEGIVLPEHLSPYVGRSADDEKTVFWALSKFNGVAVVSESGNLMLAFPSMRQRSEVSSYGLLPPYIQERPWKFSALSKETLRPVLAIGVLNFLMAITACFLLVKPEKTLSTNFLFVFLAIYATLFLLVPLIRAIIVMVLNKKVAERNQLARQYERQLGNPTRELALRLEEAEEQRRADLKLESGEIVYTTQKDYLEQITDSDFQKELRRQERM